ncbi:hypothetical protein A3F06_01835 [candidate division TM6 bacterium RIFCSPHIGHO2_12_FULL_36_22]|nr:MAG: hypothetical protein A3F06_01835 [candidate division TM6 bacterium RIFCSPHIGHO2_12_FULL_36_22]
MAIAALIQSAFFLFVGVFGVGFLIGFHEFGHFIFAKLLKIKAPSFSIGMGPSIIKKKIGHTTFQLSALPLGGYVEIVDALDPDEKDPEQIAKMQIPGKFFSETPYWQKLIVMLGGITFNFLLGFVIFSFLFTVGMPKSQLINPAYKQETIIAGFTPGSVGLKAGLQVQDKIIAGNGSTKFTNASEVIAFLRSNAGKQVHLTIEQANKQRVVPVQLNPQGQIGVLFKTEIMPSLGLFESIKMGFSETISCFWNVVASFKSIITRQAKGDLAGPIMIVAQIVMGARLGYRIFFLLLAFLSINLAFLNMIPVPITDGGQILFNTIEAIIRRPLSEKIRIAIHYVSWISVLALFIVLSLKDILSLIGINIHSILAMFTS